ncbi:MAG: PHP domain-containing protein, partial [Planctomycetota bacterium]
MPANCVLTDNTSSNPSLSRIAMQKALSTTQLICLAPTFMALFCLAQFLPMASGFAPQTQQRDTDPEPRWWKGNLHTHSLWSDGNDFPEVISDWYLQNGYHFLAISDHNVLQQGIKWMNVQDVQKRSHGQGMDRYLGRFGKAWVETRGEPGTEKYQVRLKPFDEYRYLLEQNGHFILIPAEEITDSAEGHPVHMNATNLDEVIKP